MPWADGKTARLWPPSWPPCRAAGLRGKVFAPDSSGVFLGSSAVERSTVNRLVAGSNPARGVIGSTAAFGLRFFYRHQPGCDIEPLKNPEDSRTGYSGALQASTGFQPPPGGQTRAWSPQTGLGSTPSPQADPRRQGKNGENAFKLAAVVAMGSSLDIHRLTSTANAPRLLP